MPTVEQAPVLDLGDARFQHGQSPIEGCCRGDRGAAKPRLALDQRLHVVKGIEPLPGIVRG